MRMYVVLAMKLIDYEYNIFVGMLTLTAMELLFAGIEAPTHESNSCQQIKDALTCGLTHVFRMWSSQDSHKLKFILSHFEYRSYFFLLIWVVCWIDVTFNRKKDLPFGMYIYCLAESLNLAITWLCYGHKKGWKICILQGCSWLVVVLNLTLFLLQPMPFYFLLLLVYYGSIYLLYRRRRNSPIDASIKAIFLGRDKLSLLLELGLGLHWTSPGLYKENLHSSVCSLLEEGIDLDFIIQVLKECFYLRCPGKNNHTNTFYCSKLRSLNAISSPRSIYTLYKSLNRKEARYLIMEGSIFVLATLGMDYYVLCTEMKASPLNYLVWVYRLGIIGQYISLYIARWRLWAVYTIHSCNIINYLDEECVSVEKQFLNRVRELRLAHTREQLLAMYMLELGYPIGVNTIIAGYERDSSSLLLIQCNKCNKRRYNRKGRTYRHRLKR